MKRIKSTHSGTNNSKNNHKSPHFAGSTPASKRKVLKGFNMKETSEDIVHIGSIPVIMRRAKCNNLCGLGAVDGQKRGKPGRSRRPPHTLPGTQQETNTKPEKK